MYVNCAWNDVIPMATARQARSTHTPAMSHRPVASVRAAGASLSGDGTGLRVRACLGPAGTARPLDAGSAAGASRAGSAVNARSAVIAALPLQLLGQLGK